MMRCVCRVTSCELRVAQLHYRQNIKIYLNKKSPPRHEKDFFAIFGVKKNDRYAAYPC
jgi:hypothetical protein